MKTMLITRFGTAVAVGVCWLVAGHLRAADHESNLHKTFTASPGGKLVVEADRGSIEVTAKSEETVDIQVFRKVTRATAAKAQEVFAAHEVTFQQEGNQVFVRAKYNKDWSGWRLWGPNLQVRYEITVPKQFNVDLKTAGGGITVSDLTGDARAQTAGGSIKLGAIDGQVWAHTAGGNIHVASATKAVEVETAGGGIQIGQAGGSVTAETAGGSITITKARDQIRAKTAGGGIHIEDAGAAVKAETAGGNITIKKAVGKVAAHTAAGGIEVGEAASAIDASTSGGSITATIIGPLTEDCRLETAAGNVTLIVPDNLSANLDARTAGGHVTTELPVTVQGEQKQSSLQGKLGAGGNLLKLRTSGGSIYLKKR